MVAVAADSLAPTASTSEAPSWLRALILTLVVAAGAGLAVAWVRFENEAERIEDAIEHQADLAASHIGDRRPPRNADAFWFGRLARTVLAISMAFLTAVWWAA